MKPFQIENGIIIYYGSRVGCVRDGHAAVDPMFEGEELRAYLNKQKNIQEVQWTDGMFERLMSGFKDTREIQALKECRVWQIKPDVDIRMKFIGYDDLRQEFGSPDPENYQCVFDGMVETNDLEELYTKFNIDHPDSYTGHSLSMSDVLELYDEMGSSFYYVDCFGFQKVDFSPSAPQMGQSMQL